jgi:hypothetical protein
MDDPFDLDKLRLKGVQPHAGKTAAPKTRKRHQRFIMVPLAWEERLSKTNRVSAFKLALHLLYLDWKSDGHSIRLANGALKAKGLDRKEKTRALRELERLDLVVVEWRFRKSPIVKVRRSP